MKMQSEELSVDTLVEFLTNKVEPGLKLVCQQREQKLGEQTNKQKVSLRSDWPINSARKQETAEGLPKYKFILYDLNGSIHVY